MNATDELLHSLSSTPVEERAGERRFIVLDAN
jgi:hypothetical protein